MMASTLAANLSTMPPASGREREHKIAPMASRRRYVCEPLHVADVWHVRRMIHRTGLRYHKLKHYVDRPAEITGVVVRDGKVVVPNRQRLKHRKTRLALQQPGSGDQRLKGRLSGLAGQMRQIDSMNEPG